MTYAIAPTAAPVPRPTAIAVESLAPAALAIPPAAVPASTPATTPVVSGDIFSHPATARPTTKSIATDLVRLPFIKEDRVPRLMGRSERSRTIYPQDR